MPKTPPQEKPLFQKLRVYTTPSIKLKDKEGRQDVPIRLKALFGFIPDVIIVSKVQGAHDTITVSAVLTDEEMKRVDEEKKKQEPAPEKHKGFEIKDLPPKKV